MPATLHHSLALLEKRSEAIKKKLGNYPKAKKWFKLNLLHHSKLRQKSTQILAGAGLVGAILTTPVHGINPVKSPDNVISKELYTHKQQTILALQDLLPHRPAKISEDGAPVIENLISQATGINVKAYYQGQSLNHTVGYTGFEQHLRRYPGDTLDQHDDLQDAGVAPGLGAWGYFAKDASKFTTTDYLREKYYCVVQTLYLPNWNQDFAYLRDWYQYRKVMMLNPENGQAVICDIADAGPADWTGKQFGASPETMKELGLDKGPRKGFVVLLFVDDPDNKVPLGPVNY